MVTALSDSTLARSPAGDLAGRLDQVPDSWRTGHDRAVDWLGPVGAYWTWRKHARCQDVDSSLFFSPDGERGAPRRRREQAAKAICRHCPVLDFCADYALANHEPHGVWGGLTESERAAIWDADEVEPTGT